MFFIAPPSSIFLAEADIYDEQLNTVTNIQSTFSVGNSTIELTGSASLVRTVFAAASLSVFQAVQGTWETISAPKSVQEIDYRNIEERYKQIAETVSELANLDEDDDRKIDEDARSGAQEVIHWLDMASVPAPKIFSHGGDSLVFTWDLGSSKRYLTPIDGIARVREYSSVEAGRLIDSHNFDLKDGAQTVKLLKLVGGTKWKLLQPY